MAKLLNIKPGNDVIVYGNNKAEDDWIKPKRIVEATFETPHFDFRTIAESREEAFAMLERAWEIHAELSGADLNYLEDFKEDVEFRTLEVGQVWKDGGHFYEAEKENG